MPPSRRHLLLTGVATAFFPAAGHAATTHRVDIPQTRTAFEPAEITIKAGDTVTWRNRGIVEHSVLCDPTQARDPTHSTPPKGVAPFDSGPFADSSWEHTFTAPGTYLYVCREHEGMGMRGKVIVVA